MASKCKVCGEPKHRSWPMQLPCPHAERLLAEARAEVERLKDGLSQRNNGCDLPQGCCEWCGVAKEARYERDVAIEMLHAIYGIVCRPLGLDPSGASENDVRAGVDSIVLERDAMRPVVEAAERLTDLACPSHEVESRFEAAVDAYRRAKEQKP